MAFRECIYVFITLLGLCINPTFLMIDFKASWSEDRASVFLYIIAPEKYVFLCIRSEDYCYDACLYGILALLSAMDMCGVVALVWSIAVQNVYLAMITGYCITAVGGFPICIICFRLCVVDKHNSNGLQNPATNVAIIDGNINSQSLVSGSEGEKDHIAARGPAGMVYSKSFDNNRPRNARGVTNHIQRLLNQRM